MHCDCEPNGLLQRTKRGMPSWKDTITDEEIWAVSYYVKSLMELKDSQEREVFMKKLEAKNKVFEANGYRN